MSNDLINSALNRSKNRELFVGAGIQHLGKARRKDVELLADLLTSEIDLIAGSAATAIPLKADGSRVLSEQDRIDAIVKIAADAMCHVFLATLKAADRALRKVETDDG